ncbi:hypothetical protein SMF913_14428 [Streptomyces malaysiensis]|uniref:Uncharacterized protein n=1 Tax=Streptomyces malaysiensis TaxID=92644 RepID=A0A2J7ZDQ6_STRMQ|nr:hypothetical protein SMF913_14428 [Streptomyces malaysiensis]
MSLHSVRKVLSIHPEGVCILVVVIIMVAWPAFARTLSVYVDAATFVGLIIASRLHAVALGIVPCASRRHRLA